MQHTPLILRQSLRSISHLSRPTIPKRTSHAPPVKAKLKPILSTQDGSRFRPASSAICLPCQLRAQARFYSTQKDDGSWRNSGRFDMNGDGNTELSCSERSRPLNPEGTPAQLSTGTQVGLDFNKAQQHEGEQGAGAGSGGRGREQSEQAGLPSEADSRRSSFARKFGDVMDNIQSNVFVAGRHLNDLTGYSSIEKLKQEIQEQEARVRDTRAAVRDAKETYTSAINRRSTSQREVNELLQRKHAWTPADLERFTSLYRSDHANERAETESQSALAAAERDAEEAAARLNKNILARYHEEQIWSDKIRRMSTWGTWGLMGVNVLLFLVFQVAVEPWRRQRLVRGFEDKVLDALEKENGKTGKPAAVTDAESVSSETASPEDSSGLSADDGLAHESLQTQSPAASQPLPTATPTHILPSDTTSPESWKQAVRELFSERPVSLSQRDLTTIALESAAAGAAVMGVLVAILRPQ